MLSQLEPADDPLVKAAHDAAFRSFRQASALSE
jgi:hypothetical protein